MKAHSAESRAFKRLKTVLRLYENSEVGMRKWKARRYDGKKARNLKGEMVGRLEAMKVGDR